jgi:hypothetical protein
MRTPPKNFSNSAFRDLSDGDKLHEVWQRMRRTETRLTKFLETQGFDTQVSRARWDGLDGGALIIPSRDITLRECLDAIPHEQEEDVPVYIGDDLVCWLALK